MQKNAVVSKKVMTVLNHVKSLEHWTYSHVKMNLPTTLEGFEL